MTNVALDGMIFRVHDFCFAGPLALHPLGAIAWPLETPRK